MRLPTLLLRLDPNAHKNQFGHILIIAGSPRMLGAAVLCGLSALRSGSGLVTIATAKSLNLTLHKKLPPEIMTFPLAETSQQTISNTAFKTLKSIWDRFDAIAIGPGLSTQTSTQRFIKNIILHATKPLVIDADALNALADDLSILRKNPVAKVLTPHPGELSRLVKTSKKAIESSRSQYARAFSQRYRVILLLKGHHTIIADTSGKIITNKTGNPGMATAGSGDVLTGMITSFLGRGLKPFEAAKWGAYIHGLAGDLSAKNKTQISMTAGDIIEHIPKTFKLLQTKK